jgi:serine/threonine protein phosphatase 1
MAHTERYDVVSKTYAIADLHGRFDLLRLAYTEIGKHAANFDETATIVTLGDYIDRGPQSRLIIEALMSGGPLPHLKLISLRGNHEEIMLETIREPLHPEWWIENGGGQTLISYGHPREGLIDLRVVPAAHLDWIASLPYVHADKHRVYVHAYVNRELPLDTQDKDMLIWTLYSENDEGGYGMRHVIHGHQQFADGPTFKKARTDLDTFAWNTGRLVVGVFDDDIPGGPMDLIEVKGEPYSKLMDAA